MIRSVAVFAVVVRLEIDVGARSRVEVGNAIAIVVIQRARVREGCQDQVALVGRARSGHHSIEWFLC